MANALSSAAEGVASALAAAAPSVPLVGMALAAISALMTQLQNVHVAAREAASLTSRLARLQTLVERSAGEGAGAFSNAHPGIFLGLVDTLRRAERALGAVAERSRLGAFIASSSDADRVAAIDRAISLHVAELSAALSAETMASVRLLHARINAASLAAMGTPGDEEAAAALLKGAQGQQRPFR